MKSVETESIKLFNALGLSEFDNLAVVSTEVSGVETDTIAVITQAGDGYAIKPLLVVVNEKLFQQMQNPGEV